MKKLLFFLVTILSTNFLFAQFSGNFETTTPNVPLGNCMPFTSLSTTPFLMSWYVLEDSPMICGVDAYPTNGTNNGTKICTLSKVIEDDVVIENQSMFAMAWTGNSAGLKVEISFDYANLGTVEGFEGDFSASLVVRLGESETHNIQLPPYDPDIEWQRVVIPFCTGDSGKITITPEIYGNGANSSVVIGIDNIEYKRLENEPCPCVDCSSFKLEKNERYVISGWVKETNDNLEENDAPILGSSIQVIFPEAVDVDPFEFLPSGNVINGWQKIYGEFTVPDDAIELQVGLYASNSYAFFDDIRIHPVNSNLKSFVYDQSSQKLMAELDENNYATFYEYDKEGGLVRVKKETEQGVFTIQESRSGNVKE